MKHQLHLGDQPVGKATKKDKPKAEPDGVVARLEAVYTACYRRKFVPCLAHQRTDCLQCGDAWASRGPEYEIEPWRDWGRDRKHLKDMAAVWGEARVGDIIRDFFASTDPRIRNRDYKVKVLFENAQWLLQAQRNRAPDARTAANIDAASRAKRR